MPKPPPRRVDDAIQQDHSSDRRWYIDKRISLDTIINVVGIAVVLGGPFILWGRSMEQAQNTAVGRLTLIEDRASTRDKFDEKRDNESKQRQQEMQASISKLDDRLQTAQSEFQRQLTTLQLQIGQVLNSVKR